MRTVNPPGGEAALAELFASELRRAGVESRVVPTPSAQPEIRRAAVWGRVRGRGERPPLVLLSHLDVVRADPGDWSDHPFAGTIDDGYVIGRGALDAKGLAVVHAQTLMELARREQPLERDVILLATPDEETGGRLGAGTIVREHPELFAGAAYVLTEGGSILLQPGGAGPAIWAVTVTEKSPCWLELRARGTPGHSATPRRDAAVPRLIAALERVRQLDTPVRVVPEVGRMFRELSARAEPANSASWADLDASLAQDPVFRERFLRNGSNNALVRDTLSITVLRGGPNTNVAPREALAHIDARLLPGSSCEALRQRVERLVDDPAVRVGILLSFESRSSPVDTPLYRAIARTAADTDTDSIVVPRMIAGFSDAHWFRERGIVAYGFVPRWLTPDDTRGIHGPDERISIHNLERGVLTLVRILEELDAAE